MKMHLFTLKKILQFVRILKSANTECILCYRIHFFSMLSGKSCISHLKLENKKYIRNTKELVTTGR